jgi:hypothetical protein
MEIENEEERSVDSFQAEMDLVNLEEEEENKPSQKDRLAKMMERLKHKILKVQKIKKKAKTTIIPTKIHKY